MNEHRTSERSDPHIFEDPAGDPFIKWVELDNQWYRIDESVLVEWEEDLHQYFVNRLERRFHA